MRVGNWKLVAKGPAGEWELYDIDRDRSEMHNLASQQPERVKQMVAQWEDMGQAGQRDALDLAAAVRRESH